MTRIGWMAALVGTAFAQFLAGNSPTPAATGAQRPDASVKAVTTAAAAYLAEYQKQLSFLLADESYTQRVSDGGRHETESRTMTGESFLTFVPADHAWMSVHDVAVVDGREVDDREDLQMLLQRDSITGVAQLLMQRNARFNIGSITRNFNEPTLGLLVLEPLRRPQFKFDRKRVDRDGDVDVVTLAFKEIQGPTLVRGVNGTQVFSTGELAIEAGTGRIRRSFMRLTYGSVIAQLTTQYAREAKLDLWVPAVFSERYEQTRKDLREVIVCEATYTNYRRFDVKVRIR